MSEENEQQGQEQGGGFLETMGAAIAAAISMAAVVMGINTILDAQRGGEERAADLGKEVATAELFDSVHPSNTPDASQDRGQGVGR